MAITEMNSALFQKEIVEAGKPALVEFYAPWCVYCRRIAPAYEKIAQQFGDEINVVKVNIDEAGSLARREQIEVIPTLVVYKEGFEMGSIVAPESKARIEEFLAEAL